MFYFHSKSLLTGSLFQKDRRWVSQDLLDGLKISRQIYAVVPSCQISNASGINTLPKKYLKYKLPETTVSYDII